MSRLLLALLLLLANAGSNAEPAPRRIVSLNLCTDQMVLALVPRERIAMLSQLAADPSLSWLSARAAGIRAFDGSVESVVQLEPDLILAGSLASVGSAAVLERLGYRVETLEMPETIAGSLDFIEDTARLLGEQDAGRALREATAARLEAVRGASAALRPGLALVYLPNGLSPGAGTLKHELLAIAGWRNLAAERGIEGYGVISLEDLVTRGPDAVLFDAADLEHASLAQQLLRHPALREHLPAAAVPTGSWICGGPQIAAAAELLLKGRRRFALDHASGNQTGHDLAR